MGEHEPSWGRAWDDHLPLWWRLSGKITCKDSCSLVCPPKLFLQEKRCRLPQLRTPNLWQNPTANQGSNSGPETGSAYTGRLRVSEVILDAVQPFLSPLSEPGGLGPALTWPREPLPSCPGPREFFPRVLPGAPVQLSSGRRENMLTAQAMRS